MSNEEELAKLRKVKEALFALKNDFYPATNDKIKDMSVIRLINRAIGNMESAMNIFYQGYVSVHCDKCGEHTYQESQSNWTTTRCIICGKRNKKMPANGGI